MQMRIVDFFFFQEGKLTPTPFNLNAIKMCDFLIIPESSFKLQLKGRFSERTGRQLNDARA